jgi:hypothetical protein
MRRWMDCPTQSCAYAINFPKNSCGSLARRSHLRTIERARTESSMSRATDCLCLGQRKPLRKVEGKVSDFGRRDEMNSRKILRPQETGESSAVTPEEKELQCCNDEGWRETFGRHEGVENQYVEDDCGENR